MTEVVPHRRTVPPGSPVAAEIARLVAVVGERLQVREDELNTTMCEAIEESNTELVAPEMRTLLHSSVQGNIVTILQLLRHDVPLSSVEPIPQAVEYATALAQRGVPAASLRRAYHFGSDDLLAQIFEEVRQIDIDAETRLRLLHHLAGWVHTYVDWITRQVLDAYEDERRQIADRSASLAASLVRGVLTSDQPPVGFTERTGYRLDQDHLAAVLWVAGGNPGVDLTDELHDVANEVAGAIGSSRLLVTAVDRSTCWVWIGRAPQAELVQTAHLRPALARHRSVRMALGSSARGIGGFRRSHAEAEATRHVLSAAQTGEQVLSYSDRAVGPLSLLLQNREALGRWVSSVLGPLAAPDEPVARMRETLRVFLAHDGNFQAAADELLLHRNTVKYRVGKALEHRGAELAEDRLDLELALEVVRLLGPAALR
jgi:hypothetical protein